MDSDDPSRCCQRVVYRGRVQGVGFRYTVMSIAKRYPVGGYVKNLTDGTVELIAQSTEHILNKFLGEVSDAFEAHIHGQSAEPHDPDEAFRHFEIR